MRTITPPLPPSRRLLAAACGLLGLALPLGACTEDPFERPGTWRASGVNETNLRAQVTDPAVLQSGLAAGTARGQGSAMPITLLEEGRRPRVPTTALTVVGRGGGETSAAGSAR